MRNVIACLWLKPHVCDFKVFSFFLSKYASQPNPSHTACLILDYKTIHIYKTVCTYQKKKLYLITALCVAKLTFELFFFDAYAILMYLYYFVGFSDKSKEIILQPFFLETIDTFSCCQDKWKFLCDIKRCPVKRSFFCVWVKKMPVCINEVSLNCITVFCRSSGTSEILMGSYY